MWGFIDRDGRLVISPQFQEAAGFSDGLARFKAWEPVSCGGPETGRLLSGEGRVRVC